MNFIDCAEGEEEVSHCQAVISRGFFDETPYSVAGHDLMLEVVVTGAPQPGDIFVTTAEKGREPISIDDLATSPRILIFEITARKQTGMEVRYAGWFGNPEMQFKGPTRPFAVSYSIPKFLKVQFGAPDGWQVEGRVSRAVKAAMAKHSQEEGGRGERSQQRGGQASGSQYPGGQGHGGHGSGLGSQNHDGSSNSGNNRSSYRE